MQDFSGVEFEWLAVDSDGSVGLMFTGGAGFVPRVAAQNESRLLEVVERLFALPARAGASLVLQDGAYRDDWIQMAKRGLFAFDWSRESGLYVLVAKPDRKWPEGSFFDVFPFARSAVCRLRVSFESLTPIDQVCLDNAELI